MDNGFWRRNLYLSIKIFFIKVSQHLTIFPDGILMRDCFGSLSTRTYDWHIWIERVVYNLSYDHYT